MATNKSKNGNNHITLLKEFFDKISKDEGISSADYDLTKILKGVIHSYNEAVKKEDERIQKEKIEEEKRREEEERIKQEMHVNEVLSMDLPMEWENSFLGDSRTQNVHVDSISDALIMSLSNLGRVDIEYISSITGEDLKSVISALKGSIYQNPETWGECFYKGWETSEEYLSGNLMRKIKKACEANDIYRGYFQDNITAIKKVLPDTVEAKDIYVTLGSPWVPTDVINDFVNHILKLKNNTFKGTVHDEMTGTWELQHKSFFTNRNTMASLIKYGTKRIDALNILERTLNMKTVAVTDEVDCNTNKSGKKRVINQTETVLAIEKQQKLIDEFQEWVWSDPKRKERLEIIFENNYGCVRRRIFDGSFLQFPTLSPNIELYPYQKNAVARILFSPNTLLAHDVGSGKTYIMIAAGMEMKRMGLSKKNLYVVPNNIVGQWESIFFTMYPSAKVFCVDPKNFDSKKREATLKKIRDEDFDAIIMAYSCFERIPLSKSFYLQELNDKKGEIEQAIANKTSVTNNLRKRRDEIAKQIAALTDTIDHLLNSVTFDELGITRLFVDEAHNYKNLPIETKTSCVLGISSSGSKKCQDMLDKVHFIQKENGGGGVVMATGTPITNSITDAFVMQKYLQSGELAMLDLQSFDSWIGMFAEKVTEFEIDVDTNSYRLATRFSKFHNLPELTALLSSIADFHQVVGSEDIPDFDGYSDALIGKTKDFSDYLNEISSRAEQIRAGVVSRKDDNMLKITTDGRKAALDIRLVNSSVPFTYQSKVARCADNVYDIYYKTCNTKGVQLVFCDSSTPKNGFNIYDELKCLLVSMGIPSDEIAYVHDADTELQRSKLFAMVRMGEIRVLIGSTFKLGLGVNVQNKLVALHHLDIPWRPADMTQREGRILRQGNENSKVEIFRYITEGSFDAYSWQLLETKQRFISGLLSGSLSDRSGSDVESTVLDYAEVKALAIGNPLIKKRVEKANELSRYLTLQKKAIENHIALEKELMEIPAKIEHQVSVVEKCRADIEHFHTGFLEYSKEERKFLRKKIFDAVKSNVLVTEERVLMTYQGFDIVLPVNMTMEKPFIWLQRNGRYYVELADTEMGILVRIDNFLAKFEEYLERMKELHTDLCKRQSDIKNELALKEDYCDMIEEIKTELETIDKKLGVKKNG